MPDSNTTYVAAELWRFPVKSMQGEQVPEAMLTDSGVLGDRAYALIDVATGKVVTAKSVRLFPTMFACRAEFIDPPAPGNGAAPVRITLPDGSAVTSNDARCDEVLSRHFQREVHLASAAPKDYTIDQYHPDVADVDPHGYRDVTVDQKLGSALFSEMGVPSAVPVGSLVDAFPVSVLTTSTLARLRELRPESRFDQRRFRMNLIVDTGPAGFIENDWIGRAVNVGDRVRIRVAMPDPRCVMTTLAQPGLDKDTAILRTLVQHNRLDVGGGAHYPCAGVYAVVETAGTLRARDTVVVN